MACRCRNATAVCLLYSEIALLLWRPLRQACVQAISFETDAYAIIDTFRWIEPKIYTLVIGEAFGNAALIVAAGGLLKCSIWLTTRNVLFSSM